MNEEERNVLEQQLQENGIGDIYYCRCGSYTLTCENGQSYSCHSRNIEKIFPRINHGLFKKYIKYLIRHTTTVCDHCGNRWGLDICSCGSGISTEKCDNGYEGYCGTPMQLWGGYTSRRSKHGWIQ